MNIFIKAADGLPFPFQEPVLPDELNLGCGLTGSYALGKKLQMTKAGQFFCAHLAAETLMRMGLLAIHPMPANGYDPADFATDTMPFTGCKYGPVVKVIWTPPAVAAPAVGGTRPGPKT